MKKAFKYRFYPTSEQENLLRRTVGCCRFTYNKALAIRSEAWVQRKERLSGYDLIKKITEWKKDEETRWLSEVSSVPLQQTVNDLEVAFRNFFEKRAKYPNFKKKSSGGSCRFTSVGFRIKNGAVWLAKTTTPLNIRWSRPLPKGKSPSQCTVRLTPSGQWYISFLCDVEIPQFPKTDKEVGLDMGITTLVTTSDGEKFANPRTMKQHRQTLAQRQRVLSRKAKGSRNREKARRKVARTHQKISDTRKDYQHKLTTRLVHENQVIVIEDLQVRNLMANHCLAGAIGDAGWHELRHMLEYKCKWYGRELRVIDKWFPSSKTDHKTGARIPNLKLSDRVIRHADGTTTCRDINAAKNILAAGHVVNACGGDVRPKGLRARRQSPVKQETTRVTGGIPRL